MAFQDPITISSTALARTGFGMDQGAFASADGSLTVAISHSKGKRTRRAYKLTKTKTAADPLNPTTNKPYSMSVTLVVDVPPFGFDTAEATSTAGGLLAYLTASTNAELTKFVSGQS